jgi:hypothetical protein
MSNALLYGWIICYLISYLIIVILPLIVGDTTDLNKDKLGLFSVSISWILNVAAFIMFIIWLTKFKNKKVLQTIWILALVTFIVTIALYIFLTGNASAEVTGIPENLIFPSLTIFIGSFITFLIRK